MAQELAAKSRPLVLPPRANHFFAGQPAPLGSARAGWLPISNGKEHLQ